MTLSPTLRSRVVEAAPCHSAVGPRRKRETRRKYIRLVHLEADLPRGKEAKATQYIGVDFPPSCLPSLSTSTHRTFLSLDCCFEVRFFLPIVFQDGSVLSYWSLLSRVRLVSPNSFDPALFQHHSPILSFCFEQKLLRRFYVFVP